MRNVITGRCAELAESRTSSGSAAPHRRVRPAGEEVPGRPPVRGIAPPGSVQVTAVAGQQRPRVSPGRGYGNEPHRIPPSRARAPGGSSSVIIRLVSLHARLQDSTGSHGRAAGNAGSRVNGQRIPCPENAGRLNAHHDALSRPPRSHPATTRPVRGRDGTTNSLNSVTSTPVGSTSSPSGNRLRLPQRADIVMKSRAHEVVKKVAGPCVVCGRSLLPLAGAASPPGAAGS